ncbi:MAG TPA: serine hydrolase domain-containing protein, partial [Myxococcota bacterium]|nr:serine hydrolase domain-containing protein [Myxococcota bacterium]
YVDGRPAVDLWGGWADPARSRPWQRDTLVCVFSCTKGMVALCAHLLADRGQLDYDAPVARYWPEFAAAGKAAITVRQLLSHQAGLPLLREPLPPGGIYDWDRVVRALAAEKPHWEPGTAHGYHTLSFGHLVGELVRRIDGRDVGRFFREEVAQPLRADFLIGVGEQDEARVAELAPPPERTQLGPVARAALEVDAARIARYDDPHLLVPPVVNTRVWRAAQIPGGNGHGNARALARVYAALARGGELDGVRLISPAAIARMSERQVLGKDRTIGIENEFALGFHRNGGSPLMRLGNSPTAFGHGGAYGSIGMADPARRIGLGYVMNQCGEPLGDPRGPALVEAVYACL